MGMRFVCCRQVFVFVSVSKHVNGAMIRWCAGTVLQEDVPMIDLPKDWAP